MRPHVITGGPGIGKTTTIDLLASRGYAVLPEVARMICEEETKNGSDIVPWKNLQAFEDKVATRQLELEKALPQEMIAFLDRGIIDGYGYSKYGNVIAPHIIEEIARGRYEKIFILERLAIYKNDSIRLEDNEAAQRIHEAIRDAYIYFGYKPILVPSLSPEERVAFILDNLNV